jgi:glycosyltransferase involved in cell wall biosynthesis
VETYPPVAPPLETNRKRDIRADVLDRTSAQRHLHFTQSLEPLQGGGLGSSTVALHRQMRSLGLDSSLCATVGKAQQHMGENVFEFRRIRPGFLFYAPELRKQVRALASAADVLHGHGLYVGTNWLFGREARRQDKSLVYHVHGMFEPYILGRSRWKKMLVHWVFEDSNFRAVRLWRALTSKEADQIRACGIRAPIVVAPNGVSLSDYPQPPNPGLPIATPQVPRLEKTRRRALFLGRIHPKKGLDLLLNAWARLGRARADWQLVVAGPDQGGHAASILSLSRSLGLEGQIVYTGPVTGATKAALLYSADLFVLTSYSEGFPVSILEAMACGLPVAATRASNFPYISSADAGWECETAVDAVSDTLAEAVRCSDSERSQRGQNGRRLVERQFCWGAIIDQLLQACAAHC